MASWAIVAAIGLCAIPSIAQSRHPAPPLYSPMAAVPPPASPVVLSGPITITLKDGTVILKGGQMVIGKDRTTYSGGTLTIENATITLEASDATH